MNQEQGFLSINYIYYLLARGFGQYSQTEFMDLLSQARIENYLLYEENLRLKQEIEIMNTNIVANLERDLSAMRKQVKDYIKPAASSSSAHKRSVEKLDE